MNKIKLDIEPKGYDFPSLIEKIKKIKHLEKVKQSPQRKIKVSFWDRARLYFSELWRAVVIGGKVAKATVEAVPKLKTIMWLIVIALILAIVLVVII